MAPELGGLILAGWQALRRLAPWAVKVWAGRLPTGSWLRVEALRMRLLWTEAATRASMRTCMVGGVIRGREGAASREITACSGGLVTERGQSAVSRRGGRRSIAVVTKLLKPVGVAIQWRRGRWRRVVGRRWAWP